MVVKPDSPQTDPRSKSSRKKRPGKRKLEETKKRNDGGIVIEPMIREFLPTSSLQGKGKLKLKLKHACLGLIKNIITSLFKDCLFRECSNLFILTGVKETQGTIS